MASRNILMGLMVIPGFLIAGIAAQQAGGNESSDAITGVTETTTAISSAPETAPGTGALTNPEPDFRVVEQVGDKYNAQPTTIRRVTTGADDSVTVLAGQPVAAYEVLEVFSPFRLVVDVYGAAVPSTVLQPKASGKVLSRVRMAQHKDKVRIVLDCAGGKRPEYRVEKIAQGLRIAFVKEPVVEKSARVMFSTTSKVESAQPKVAQQASEKVAPKTATEAQHTKPEPAIAATPKPIKAPAAQASTSPSSEAPDARLATLTNLTFRQDADQASVVFELEGETRPQVVSSNEHSTVLEIPGCRMPVLLERTLDTSEFGSAIQAISASRRQGQYGQDAVRVTVATSGRVPNQLAWRGGKLCWVFEARAQKVAAAESTTAKEESDESADYRYSPDEVAGYSVQNPALAPEEGGGGRRQNFQGRRISLDFKDADIHNILRLIAEVAKINIITSDDVKGKITITMRNVPWDQALDIVLKTKKLGKVQQDNIIRIAPIEEISKEQELYQKAAEIKRVLEPLRVRIISVNFADAADVEKQVRDLLSERGTVTIDKRTNVLIVKDILENLAKAEGLVRSLDTETPQVLIEARVVEANTQFLRDVGVQWGGDLSYSASTGNATGLAFPSTIGLKGGADDSATNTTISGTANPGNFAINLPAAVGAGSGGALGFIFGSASGAAHLNLRLSALENKGTVKIISAPKITTLDNHKALIGQGVSIPISVTSAAGVNTVFVEAKLQLEVTPHITQEGSIVMVIKVAKNEPDFSRTGARGDPTILKKEAETQVMVHDGDTTVIGGIYTRKTSDTFAGVPVLSRIPILGWLFRDTKYDDERTELLIFITPRIVNRLQATVNQK